MGGFFKESSSFDTVLIGELLARKYDMNYVMPLEFSEGISFIRKAFEKETEEHLWQLYVQQFVFMNKDNYISFQDYKEKVMQTAVERAGPVQRRLSKKAILEQVEGIINLTLKGGGNIGI